MNDDLETQAAIRERRYPIRTTRELCSFFIGTPGYPCWRCNDSHGYARSTRLDHMLRARQRQVKAKRLALRKLQKIA